MTAPNIILIITDHFRPDSLGASTPNLMQLARLGTRFDNAYCAAPLCQPARTSLATGYFPFQTGINGNQSPPMCDAQRDDTFMHHLQRQGYYTALIGKHHYIDRYGVGMDVLEDDTELQRYGLDYVFQVLDDGENTHNQDRYTKHLQDKGLYDEYLKVFPERAWQCEPHPFEPDDTADGFIGCNAVRFVEQYDHQQPLYLNIGFIGPHPPFWHPGPLQHDPASQPDPIGAEPTEFDKRMRAHFMDKCTLIDDYVGKLVAALKAKGLYDNTLIIFTSDHGENAGDFGIWDKRYCYEQSWGVPLIMAGKHIVGEQRQCGNRVSKALVSHLDLYPTILAAAGVEPKPTRQRWGRNIFRMLDDEPGSGHTDIHATLGTMHMMRDGNWKIMYDPEAGGVQCLFNLATDPQERHNLAGAAGYETVTAHLLERILDQRIRLTQFTQAKEEQRVQRVRII